MKNRLACWIRKFSSAAAMQGASAYMLEESSVHPSTSTWERDAPLADQLELGPAVERLASNSCALAQQDEGFGEDVDIVDMIVPDGHLVV